MPSVGLVTNTAAKAIIKAINKEIELQAKYERCR